MTEIFDYPRLERQALPCWYEISWDSTPGKLGIVLKLHREFLEQFPVVDAKIPMIATYLKDFGWDSFSMDFDKGDGIGFNKALQYYQTTDDFVEFIAIIPQVVKQLRKACAMCEGTKKSPYDKSRKCLACRGTGKEITCDWKAVLPINVTLAAIMELVRYPDWATSSKKQQLMTIDFLAAKSNEGREYNGIGGAFSSTLVRWLVHSGQGHLPTVEAAMHAAYTKMMGAESSIDRFSASIASTEGWLNITCPGDACGINPYHSTLTGHSGYRFADHNVDNPAQALTLLAGLAALHDKVRKGNFP